MSKDTPPKTLCASCLLRGDKVYMRIGHLCIAPDLCESCCNWRVMQVIGWNSRQGWLATREPCAVCLLEAKRAFQVK